MSWNYTYNSNIWPSFCTVLFLLVLSVFSWRRRSVPGALPFTFSCIFATLWAASSVMEVASLDAATKIFWVKVQGAWQLPVTTTTTCFILEYAWPGRWLTRRNLALLSIAPLLTLVLILTNNLNHLMWLSFTVSGSVIPLRGPGNWALVAYAYGLSIVNIIVFVWLFLRSPQHRWPVVIMLVGMVGARMLYLLAAAQVIQSELLLDVLAMTLGALMYAIALFGFRLFDPIPLARQTAIEQMHTGMLVLSPQGHIASLNPAAQAILEVTAKRALGQPIQNLLPAYTDLLEEFAVAEVGKFEINLGMGAKIRNYELETCSLKDWRGLPVGRILLLQDVTRQKQAQVQIVEQQRALALLNEREKLARELHDNLGQVFAFVNTQGQAIRRLLSQGDILTADAHVGRLVEVAREADTDIRESILGLSVTLSEQGLKPALVKFLAQYEKNYVIHTQLERPEAFEDGALEPLVEVQLLRILQEALTNVRKHSGATCVRIAFAYEDGWARVTVQDDGQGFDPGAPPDGSGGHVGLRVMRERAEEVGGSLSLHSEPGQGTQVVVRVPVKEERHGG
jgi:signal transduction histidine kinase